MESFATLIAVVSAIVGIVFGWYGHSRTVKRDTANEASQDATMRSDMEYIKRGIDEVRLEQKDQGRRFDALSERVTRVEESTKQAHHRISRLEGRPE